MDASHRPWIGTANGAVIWRNNAWTPWLPAPYAHAVLNDVRSDGDGSYWMATDNGLSARSARRRECQRARPRLFPPAWPMCWSTNRPTRCGSERTTDLRACAMDAPSDIAVPIARRGSFRLGDHHDEHARRPSAVDRRCRPAWPIATATSGARYPSRARCASTRPTICGSTAASAPRTSCGSPIAAA